MDKATLRFIAPGTRSSNKLVKVLLPESVVVIYGRAAGVIGQSPEDQNHRNAVMPWLALKVTPRLTASTLVEELFTIPPLP